MKVFILFCVLIPLVYSTEVLIPANNEAALVKWDSNNHLKLYIHTDNDYKMNVVVVENNARIRFGYLRVTTLVMEGDIYQNDELVVQNLNNVNITVSYTSELSPLDESSNKFPWWGIFLICLSCVLLCIIVIALIACCKWASGFHIMR